ncbi:hypothetical protein G0Q06_05425 [Puniceicoccales bacterium CK1056]|uniref:PEP-CTERM protein-sorting domain-containing protein n=1 Tax=Oceanipulchritudo coccoides TaxID=2706888 RepID=A0A6B2M189_9BACT|nr:hypothetical protein [Oceanipulchritudo coccoides]NDV61884.1 hypothetical protein [Oceanipulchritudo coccoides]
MTKTTIGLLALTLGFSSLSAQLVLRDWQFADANGTNLNVATTTGAESGSWNFGGPQTQNGALNFGYTSFFKWQDVDDAAGSGAFRTFAFSSAITSANYSTYTFEIDLSKWDLRQNWDPSNASAAAKGIGFRILESTAGGADNAQIGFDTQGTSGFRAFSQGTGTVFSQVNGGDFDNAVNRFEANGGILRITGDLTTGAWTASANDGDGGAFKVITSGSGLTEIAAIGVFAKSPTIGSWGGAGAGQTTDPTVGGTAGDYVLIDSMTLTAVPEPATFALWAAFATLGLVMYRRRRL